MDDKSQRDRVPLLLQRAAAALCGLLDQALPSVSDRWWDTLVLPNLSFQQRRAVDVKGISKLSGLDLAALLRVLDSNWYELSGKLGLTPEDRHFLKELRTVRDRWAHSSVEEFDAQDIYRDLDTLQRFLTAIGADAALLADVRQAKEATLTIGHDTQAAAAGNSPDPGTMYQVGQIVSLKSDPGCTGAITGVHPSPPETRYSVFVGGSVKTFSRH